MATLLYVVIMGATACLAPDTAPPDTGVTMRLWPGTAAGPTGAARTDYVETIDFMWGDGAPAADLPPDGFVARFTADLVARTSEVHRLHVRTAGHVTLRVHGATLLDEGRGTVDAVLEVPLIAGKPTPVSLELIHTLGPAFVRLTWAAADLPEEVIPTDAWRPVAVGEGLGLERFAAADLRELVARDVAPTLALDGTTAGSETASARLSGRLRADRAGTALLHLSGSGPAQLLIGDVRVALDDGGGEVSAPVTLDPDAPAPLSLDVARTDGVADVRVEWSPPGALGVPEERAPIPTANLLDRGFARGPAWRFGVLVVRNTDVTFARPSDDAPVRVVARLTPEEEAGAVAAARLLPLLVHDWSNGDGAVELEIVAVDDLAITTVSPVGDSFWVAPGDVAEILDRYAPVGRFDSVFLVWDPDDGAARVPVCCWYGQGRNRETNDATFASIPNLSDGAWSGPFPAEVLIHEWEHGAAAYYRAELGLPVPDPHENDTYGFPSSDASGSWFAWYAAELGGRLVDPTTGRVHGFTPNVWAAGPPTRPVGPLLVEAPTSLTATLDADGVTLSWSAAPGADHYRVFRGEQAGDERYIAWTPATTWIDLDAPTTGPLHYVVRGVSNTMVESSDSNVAQAR